MHRFEFGIPENRYQCFSFQLIVSIIYFSSFYLIDLISFLFERYISRCFISANFEKLKKFDNICFGRDFYCRGIWKRKRIKFQIQLILYLLQVCLIESFFLFAFL